MLRKLLNIWVKGHCLNKTLQTIYSAWTLAIVTPPSQANTPGFEVQLGLQLNGNGKKNGEVKFLPNNKLDVYKHLFSFKEPTEKRERERPNSLYTNFRIIETVENVNIYPSPF